MAKNIYPLSPKEEGSLYIDHHGYRGMITTNEGFEVKVCSTYNHFNNKSEQELKALGLHPLLIQRTDFIEGAIVMASIAARRNADQARISDLNQNADYVNRQIKQLEKQFRL